MKHFIFSAAKAVFYPFPSVEEATLARHENAVAHYGFCHSFVCEKTDNATVYITARNVYRLYINGEIVMHGPARTAHGYARVHAVDIGDRLLDGENHIAVEVMVYGECYDNYSNDTTLEPGMFIAEVSVDGTVISATGRDEWLVCRLHERAARSERISHSRECAEVYCIAADREAWRRGTHDAFFPAVPLEDEPIYLSHEALLPILREYPFDRLIGFGACRIDPDRELTPLFYEKHSAYYASLDDHPLADCRRTVEDPSLGGVSAKRTGGHPAAGIPGCITLEGSPDKYIYFDMGESRVGFIGVEMSVETAGIVDIVHSELLHLDGSFPYYHNIVTRLYVPAGHISFVTMEPSLARYIKLYCRGTGRVTVHGVSMYDDAYPDEHRSSFLCNDENVNRLYEAAKKTLILNTLDIFMDCPERERGGWLCDSLWTARAAAMMLSDHRVEREFIENFLLTPADGMFHGFFPEVYPANKPDYRAMTGITTWSFWLMCELCEYVSRTGDYTFASEHEERVTAFVDGAKDFIGKSGLLENLPWVFIDWSLSNRGEYHQPISTAANALYAYMLIELGKLYGHTDWVSDGTCIRRLLRKAVIDSIEGNLHEMVTFPDSFAIDVDGRLHGRDHVSESGMATALWSGLFTADEVPALYRRVRDCMGPMPRFTPDPTVGQSQLFIGLCIRLDMLSRMGAYEKMYEDMNAIFMPQLTEGPGTLWENRIIDTSSRCHGFTAHTGVHLMRDVLGLGIPVRNADGKAHISVAPHPCGLRWAKGTVELPEGIVAVSWQYDGDRFDLHINLPADVTAEVVLPREVKALDDEKVNVTM